MSFKQQKVYLSGTIFSSGIIRCVSVLEGSEFLNQQDAVGGTDCGGHVHLTATNTWDIRRICRGRWWWSDQYGCCIIASVHCNFKRNFILMWHVVCLTSPWRCSARQILTLWVGGSPTYQPKALVSDDRLKVEVKSLMDVVTALLLQTFYSLLLLSTWFAFKQEHRVMICDFVLLCAAPQPAR